MKAAKVIKPMPPEEFRRLLGKRIKDRREELGFKQMEFALKHGIHPSMLSRIETGQSDITIPRAFVIANALGWGMKQMLDGLL